MKKKLLALLIIPAMLFAGCGESGSDAKVSTAAAKTVTDAALSAVEIASAVTKTADDLKDYYTTVDTAMVEDASFVLCGSGAYPDEYCAIKVTDTANANTVLDAVKEHYEKQKKTYETYTPDEMYKLDGAKLYVSGNYVIYLACSDNDAAKTAVDEALKS